MLVLFINGPLDGEYMMLPDTCEEFIFPMDDGPPLDLVRPNGYPRQFLYYKNVVYRRIESLPSVDLDTYEYKFLPVNTSP